MGLFLNTLKNEDPMNNELANEQGLSSLTKLIEYSKRQIEKVVCEQLFLNDLKADKWESMLTNFVMKAVE